jgi:serine/threonine-protein kinase RsbW
LRLLPLIGVGILNRKLPYGPLLTHEAIEFVEMVSDAYQLAMPIRHRLTLIVEELVTNSVNYGKMTTEGFIELSVEAGDGAVELHYADTGIAFDPVSNPPEDDRSLPAQERRIGGLGWPLIRDLSSDLSYRRDDGLNRVSLKLPLPV